MELELGRVLYNTTSVLESPADTRAVLVALSSETEACRVLLATGEVFIGSVADIECCFAPSDEKVELPPLEGKPEDFDLVVIQAFQRGDFDEILLLNQIADGNDLRRGHTA
ncbi:hypothetical protein [Burkholderia sp. MBR-1]|uniref:hypothetical protein n=1 Tax=Burkholderia sp. MBR-1 TaxID=2732364 RepID=UPI0015EEE306|nr:hypothetical protein [Burkholderia sp. MBR-1]QMI49694.1 hypothetical protein MBR110_29870 [Burkholderia sp. MBR-1]